MCSGRVTYRRGNGKRTEPPLFDLFLRLSEDRKHFDHYLYDYLRHERAQRDVGIDFEVFEEASDALEELKESVIARADSFGRLMRWENDRMSDRRYIDARGYTR
jgi:hypothetical protein